FNQFLLMRPDGYVKMSSQPAWEGSSLAKSAFFQFLSKYNDQSFLAYDFNPLYPKQLVLITVVQITSSTGSNLGTIVGVTEPHSMQDVLLGLSSLNPDADAYFVTHEGVFMGIDPYTKQLTLLHPSKAQSSQLMTALDPTAAAALNSLQFNNGSNI